MSFKVRKIKKELYDILENDELNNSKKFFFDIALAIIIIVSIILIFIENTYDKIPPHLEAIDNSITIFFIIEFLARFYVASDFINDIKNKTLWFAVLNKIKWFFKISTLIDFLAIVPALNFFRIFRTLRFLRLFRILKAYRSFKTFREVDKIFTILKGMTEENRVFYVFFSFTAFFIFILSFALYVTENDTPNSEFKSFKDAIWYSIKIIGFGDDTPKTGIGKFFSGLLLLTNMAIFGFFISLILNKIQNIMTALTSGKVGKLKLENHIIICGYTKSSQNVINDLLKKPKNINNIVLITKKEIEDNISGVIYVNADFTELKTLKDINITKAKYAIVFAESKEHDTIKDVDLRTVMTIFNIEKEAPHVHTIAEINDEQNASIIKEKIEGDEILYKELIDSRIISTCINHKHISNLFYEIFGASESNKLTEMNLLSINLPENTTVKEVKKHFIDKDVTFLGYIDDQNNAILTPKNNTKLSKKDRLIFLQN